MLEFTGFCHFCHGKSRHICVCVCGCMKAVDFLLVCQLYSPTFVGQRNDEVILSLSLLCVTLGIGYSWVRNVMDDYASKASNHIVRVWLDCPTSQTHGIVTFILPFSEDGLDPWGLILCFCQNVSNGFHVNYLLFHVNYLLWRFVCVTFVFSLNSFLEGFECSPCWSCNGCSIL